MATVAAAPENPTELKPEEVKETNSAVEEPTEPTAVAEKAKEDVNMDENEEDRKLRAVRQSTLAIHLLEFLLTVERLAVEFYFADANLPYDKYDLVAAAFFQEFKLITILLQGSCGHYTLLTQSTGSP